MREAVEWNIDLNLPMYVEDLFKHYGIDGHICDCHLQAERCYGCEAMDCAFHTSLKAEYVPRMTMTASVPVDGSADSSLKSVEYELTQTEHKMLVGDMISSLMSVNTRRDKE